jgi:LysM repeat protein
VSLGEIAHANGIDPAGVLLAGSRLAVPSLPATPGFAVTVRSGDTLSAIALRYGTSLASLSTFNRLDVTDPILVGQRLLIPPGGHVDSPLDELTPESDPYLHGASGFDISYPDCLRTLPPPSGFAVVGLNDGRPFTINPCFGSEYAAAKGSQLPPSVYLNSAYAPSLLANVTAGCAGAGAREPLSWPEQRAYALGCSEAEAAAGTLAATPAAVIWVDIESANTWSRHPWLNRATINGFLDYLLTLAPAPRVGVYSSPAEWQLLTGNWRSFGLPEWIATGPAPDPPGCPTPFAAGPVWLGQHTTSRDQDTAC